jgi:uncharacterized protein YjiS (DUF1127 family)
MDATVRIRKGNGMRETGVTVAGRVGQRRPGGGWMVLIWRALALRAQRRRLGQLDEAALRDIGVTPAQAQAEAERPVWDVPAHWRR